MGWPVGNVRQLKLGDALILTDGPLGLFIIDGVITIPIALLGFLIMPDLPTTTKPSIFLSAAQLEIGKRRMEEVGRKPPSHFTKKKVTLVFSCAAY